MRKIFTILLLCFICKVGLAAEMTKDDPMVSAVMTKLMQQYQVPGAAVAVVDHDQSYISVFGMADKARQIPVTPKTIFEVGSMTKLMTALLFVLMADHPNDLNDPLTQSYPELNQNPYFQKVTFLRLLTYTTGLPFQLPESAKTLEQAQNYLLKCRPNSAMGSQWEYSNVSIGLVGMALQNSHHATIDQLYKKYIFTPLHMTSAGIEVDQKFRFYLAQGYAKKGDAPACSPRGIFPSAGALKMSIQDLSRFLKLAVGLSHASKNLQRAMQEMQTPRLEVNGAQQGLVWEIHSLKSESLFNVPEEMDIGPLPVKWLPKERQVFDANLLMDKTGATSGFRAYMAVIPDQQKGIVILTNKYISNGAIVKAGRKILLGKS